MLLRIGLFFFLLEAAALAAGGSAPRAPTGQWGVNFTGSQCLAWRDFGTAEAPLRFVLRAPPIGTVWQLRVLRKPDKVGVYQFAATVGTGGDSGTRTTVLMVNAAKDTRRTYLLHMPADRFARVRQAERISISTDGLDETFDLSGLAPVIEKLDSCVAELRRAWNIAEVTDHVEATGLKQRASGNLAQYFSDRDYPGVAIGHEQTGKVGFGLLIDEKGAVAECIITQSSGAASLDRQTCVLLKSRARFAPAVGLDGKPARDAVISDLTWSIV